MSILLPPNKKAEMPPQDEACEFNILRKALSIDKENDGLPQNIEGRIYR
ncbi:MAG: hypothetical protein ABFD82_20675 [Syntrophaceae bacterium]